MPWRDPHVGRVVLGATVEEACSGPQQLQEALGTFSGAGCVWGVCVWGGGWVGGGRGEGSLRSCVDPRLGRQLKGPGQRGCTQRRVQG